MYVWCILMPCLCVAIARLVGHVHVLLHWAAIRGASRTLVLIWWPVWRATDLTTCRSATAHLKSLALPDTSSPTISPNSPSTELKISMTSTLTKLDISHGPQKRDKPPTHSDGSAASATAALLPLMPTATPQIRFAMPTVRPPQKMA